MINVRKEIVYTSVIVLLGFFSIAYAGCNKTEEPVVDTACSSVQCQNGGTCYKGLCTCPIGFEGTLCETKSSGKYVGKWEWEETVIVSSDQSKVGTIRKYIIDITQTSNLVYVLNINNFRGDTSYDGVLWRLGWQYLTDDDGVELQTIALPTQFLFNRKQVLNGSRITIESGNGTVNNLGTFMNGNYKTSEPDSAGKEYRETCEFKAAFIP